MFSPARASSRSEGGGAVERMSSGFQNDIPFEEVTPSFIKEILAVNVQTLHSRG